MQCADDPISVSMLGAVLGHERQIMQYIQEQLLAQHVRVTVTPTLTDAAVIIQIHRMKPRLPSNELAGVLHASAGFHSTSNMARACKTCTQ